MIRHLPVKKEYLLIGGLCLILIICYQLAFKKTIEVWTINKHLKQQLEQSAGIATQPGYIERKNVNLTEIIKRFKIDSIELRSNTLTHVAEIAEKDGVKLAEVPNQDPLLSTDKFIIQKLSFEGDFFSLTKFLNRMQSSDNIGYVRAATYKLPARTSGEQRSAKVILELYLLYLK